MDLATVLGILGLIAGVPALIMAVPPFLQMLFGRPDLEIGYDDFTADNGIKQLMITIRNKTVSKKGLGRVGVERETGDVMVHFFIRDAGTQKFIASDISGYLNSAATREFGLVLRAMAGHTLGFPVIQFAKGRVCVMDARRLMDERPLIELPQGDYLVEAPVFRGQKIYPATRRFKVGPVLHETHWV